MIMCKSHEYLYNLPKWTMVVGISAEYPRLLTIKHGDKSSR